MHSWDVVAEAERALETGETERVSRILLASSAIPGAFPPREIDGNLYVDGAMTGNILYGGRLAREGGFAALWKRLYPGTPVPPIRYWVIFNNQFRPPPEVVQPNWKSVLPRSIDTASRSATVNRIATSSLWPRSPGCRAVPTPRSATSRCPTIGRRPSPACSRKKR